MDKIVSLSSEGQPQVSIDLSRLAMIEFSQTARQMLVRYADGDAARFESQDIPFDTDRIARIVQANGSGFETCGSHALFNLRHAKYALIEDAGIDGQRMLSLGINGHGRIGIIMAEGCAQHVVDRMNRERPTLNCPVSGGGKLHMYPAGLRHAAHHTGDKTIALDFGDAGGLHIKPVSSDKGFLTSSWQTMAGVFNSYETDLCAAVVERLQFQNDDLRFIKHDNGVAVVARKVVSKVVGQDYADDKPGLLVELADGQSMHSFAFSDQNQRNKIQAALTLSDADIARARVGLKYS